MSDWKKQIHPELARRVEQVMTTAAAAGHVLRVVSGYRSHEEQNALYAHGRTRPGSRVTNAVGGQSWHNFGLAVDLAPVIGGEVCWDEKKFDWSLIGKWARAAGLEWGGDWHSFKDRPHVQLTLNLSLAAAQRLYHADLRTLRGVWKYITNHAPTSETSAENVAEKIDDLRTDTIDDLGKIQVLTKPAAPQVGNPTDKPAVTSAPQTSKSDSASQPQGSNAAAEAQPDSSNNTDKQMVNAPAKENSVATATKITIFGFVVPPALLAVISAIRDLISQGFIDTQKVGDLLLTVIAANTRYIFWAIIAVIGLLAVKKICKQITLWIQMLTAARRDLNSVEVKPS